MTAPVGIRLEPLLAWLNARVDVVEPLQVEVILGGRSNLTYTLTDATGTRWVLRRPPTGNVLESAHDVLREQRIMAALSSSPIPVPTIVGACEDRDVIGAPFFVMDFVDGLAIRDVDQAAVLTHNVRGDVSRNLMTVMAELHRVDPADVGAHRARERPGTLVCPRPFTYRHHDHKEGKIAIGCVAVRIGALVATLYAH